MAALAAIFVGREGDRLGYRKVLLYCTICAALLLVPQAFAQRTWQLFLLRALGGACIGATFPMVNAVIATTAAQARQGVAYGLKGSGDSLGRGLGPMVGAAVAASMGLRAAFIFAAVLFGLVTVMVALLMRERPRAEGCGEPVDSAVP
jgi:DHA1 family multidrug resistance protein-like MFS transporter